MSNFGWERNVTTGEVKKVFLSQQEITERDSIYNSLAKKKEREMEAEKKLISSEVAAIIEEQAVQRLKDRGVVLKHN